MKLVYFGSGAFGLPTFKRLTAEHEVVLAVTQPDRPAGRGRELTPTPIAAWAQSHSIDTFKPEDVNDSHAVDRIAQAQAQAFVVVAFGQKLSGNLLKNTFAINLHSSLLPKYRGAAPINWAMINGEEITGVSVITLADRMDAGDILAQTSTRIDPMETAGELHDRLAELGPDIVLKTLRDFERGSLTRTRQDESKASRAPRLSKADGTVSFDQPAFKVRQRVHGLTPWPGCTVRLGQLSLRLLRVCEEPSATSGGTPGEILSDGLVACASGNLRLMSVQPSGGKAMSFEAFCRGHRVKKGMRVEPA